MNDVEREGDSKNKSEHDANHEKKDPLGAFSRKAMVHAFCAVRRKIVGASLFGALIFVIGAIIYAQADKPQIWYLVALILTVLLWWVTIVWVHGLEAAEKPHQGSPITSPDGSNATQTNAILARSAKVLVNDGSSRHQGIWIVSFRHAEKATPRTRVPETMRPVAAALFLQIVNRTGAMLMIYSYKVEYEDGPGAWKETTVIPVGGKGYMEKPLVMIKGFNPALINQINLDPSQDFRVQVQQRNIAPAETVSGWLFLDSSENLSGKKLRLHMLDTTGRDFIEPIEMAPQMTDEESANTISFGGFAEDINNAKVEVPWQANAAPTTQTRSDPPSRSDAVLTPSGQASTGPITLPDGRIVVDVDLKLVCGFFKEHLAIQAKKLVEPYIGKWTNIRGTVGDLTDHKTYQSLILDRVDGAWGWIFASFNEEWWKKLEVLRKGNTITVFGEITSIDHAHIYLNNCELPNPPP